MKRRILSAFMIFCMCMSMLPQGMVLVHVSAAEESMEYTGQTEPGIYTISAPDQLKLLADQVDAGNSYADTTFKLAADIDMSSICAGFQWGGWEPIGVDPKKPFSGTFDGGKENEYKITGLFMKIDKDLLNDYYQDRRSPNLPSRGDSDDYPCFGLFGYVDGVIQNLVVEGNIRIEGVSSNYYFGGIVGYAKAGSTIKECDYAGILMTKGTAYRIGGIAGYNGGTVENCTNTGTIEMTGSIGPSKVGGIVGYNNGMVKECQYTGTIISDNEMTRIDTIGGIVGHADRESTIENCTNTGDIMITKASDLDGIGGIVGSVAAEVKNCTNKGNITVEAEGDENTKVGGIAGSVSDTINTEMTGCTNTGEIKAGNVHYVGGITGVIGSISNTSGAINTITDCTNKGSVEGLDHVGGIAGSAENITVIKKCYNQGKVMAVSNYVGGILGRVGANKSITVESCYNQGDVCGEAKYAGGIVGYDGIYATTTIENCYNTGSIDIEGESAGSIIGGAGNFNTTSGNYYLEGDLERPDESIGEKQTPKDDIQFQFGEVTYLLQEDRKNLDGSDESIWGQQLTGDEIDKYPVFTEDANKKVQGIGLWYEHDTTRYEGYANTDGNAPLPDDSILSFPDSDVTMEVGSNNNRTTFNKEGEVTLPGGGNLRIGSSSVTAPDSKATIRTKDKETVTLPEDVTVKLENDNIEMGLPDGGVMDKDGNLTIEKDDRFVIKGTTVTIPEEVVIEPDEKGNIELLPDTRAELSSGKKMLLPKGGVIDRNGNVTPYDGEFVEEPEQTPSTTRKPTPNTPSGQTPSPTPKQSHVPESGWGDVKKDTQSGEGAPKAELPMDIEDMKKAVLTEEDQRALEAGKDIQLLLTVDDAGDTVSQEDKRKIEEGASYYTVGQYLDINLMKVIIDKSNYQEKYHITNTNEPIRIVILIPDSLKGERYREYAVVRLHDGKTTILEDLDKDPDTVTIETDRFSTYAMVYTEIRDEDRVAEAKKIVEKELAGMTVTNDTTEEDIQKKLRDALDAEGYSDVALDIGDFAKQIADTAAEGKITGTVTVSKRETSADAPMDKGIEKLSPKPTVPPSQAPDAAPSAQPTVTQSPSTVTSSPEEKEKNSIALMAGFKVSQTGKKISIKWGKVKGVDGYQVYVAYCGKAFSSKPAKNVKSPSITKVSVTKIDGKKLKLKKNYKVYIAAYQIVDGKKTIVGKTLAGHIVGRKNKAHTNAKQVKLAKSSYTLQIGKSAKVKAKAVLVDKNKKQLTDKHAKEFRYRSTDTGVVKVSKQGKMKAVGKGSCIVYVYARNGYANKLKVTVK